MGIAPIWGYQLVIAIALAYLLRLNKAIVVVAAHISIPPMIPILVYLSYRTGIFLVGDQISVDYDEGFSWKEVIDTGKIYVLGAVVFGAGLALLSSLTAWIALAVYRRRKEKTVQS